MLYFHDAYVVIIEKSFSEYQQVGSSGVTPEEIQGLGQLIFSPAWSLGPVDCWPRTLKANKLLSHYYMLLTPSRKIWLAFVPCWIDSADFVLHRDLLILSVLSVDL